jgi:hypothetical protein
MAIAQDSLDAAKGRSTLEDLHEQLVRTRNMKHSIILLIVLDVLSGCVQKEAAIPSNSQPTNPESKETVQTIRLQYRISMDAVAPSRFVALYSNGMTMGLKVHWKVGNEKKAELDTLIDKLEKDGVNGQEFTVKAKWIDEGFELEVYEIDRKF